MFVIWVTTFIAICIATDFFLRRRINNMAKNIPGPPVYPLIGSSFSVRMRNIEEVVGYAISYVEKYGKIVRLWAYWQMVIIISDPKALDILLTSPKYLKKSLIYKLLREWLGDGLLLSKGKKWFQRRKIITPTFHFKILEEFVEIFDEQSTILVECIKEHCDKGAFDVNPYITLSALDMIAETALGVKIKAQSNPCCEYAKAVHDMSDVVTIKILKPLLAISSVSNIFMPNLRKRQNAAIKILHSFTETIIEERRQYLLQISSTENGFPTGKDEFGRKRKMALLDVLLQAKIDEKPLSNLDIREEVDTFTFEGHDTTTSGISFTLYCLSRYQYIQNKVFVEIRDVIGDDISKPVGLNDLNDLKYLDLVIKESMRLYPPVPVIGRMLEEDFQIDGSVLPVGTEVYVPIFIILKDPINFPNPEEFNPERFTTERFNENSNPYAYIPFSAGPRNCIGQKYAMLEMKSTISKIIRHYELLPMGEAVKPIFSLVTRSKNGVNLGIRPRIYK